MHVHAASQHCATPYSRTYAELSTCTPRAFGLLHSCCVQVVGVFLESCTPEEAAAAKKLALEQPPAPSADELAAQGVAFATSRA